MKPRYPRIFGGLLATTISLTASAQTYPHTSLWLRVAPLYKLSARWSILGDVHYRRQSSPLHGLAHPLDAPLLGAARLAVIYNTRHWQYFLFPVGYFYTYPMLGTAADLTRAPATEWRPTALAEWTTALTKKTMLRLRVGYEYRIFTAPAPEQRGRFRFRALWRRATGQRTYAQLWNETLLTAPPNAPALNALFDLNRTNLAVGYSVSNTSTLEMGYQYTHRQRRNLIEFDQEHALTLTWFLRLNP